LGHQESYLGKEGATKLSILAAVSRKRLLMWLEYRESDRRSARVINSLTVGDDP